MKEKFYVLDNEKLWISSKYVKVTFKKLQQTQRVIFDVLIKNSCVCVLSCFSCVWLCDPMDCSPPGSSVHGIHQARIWEWNARLSSRASSWRQERSHRDQTRDSYLLHLQSSSLPLVPPQKPKELTYTTVKINKNSREEKG